MKSEVVSVKEYKNCCFVSVVDKDGARIVGARDNICCIAFRPRLGQEIRVVYSKKKQRRYGFEVK